MTQTAHPVIDTHQHFWRLARGGYAWMPKDVPALYRDYDPHDLHPLLEQNGVTGTIAVQADDNVAETEFLLSLAAETPWICGVVGWVNLETDAGIDDIQRLAGAPKFVGVRPMIQDIADDDWLLTSVSHGALKALGDNDLTFDALVLPRHLTRLATFARQNPDLRIVVDHCAKPEVADARISEWARGIAAVADCPNTFCKLSGLLTEAGEGDGLDALRPYLDHVLRVFGPNRILFGSDWPVLNLVAGYGDWMGIMIEYAKGTEALNWDRMMSKTPFDAYPRLRAG